MPDRTLQLEHIAHKLSLDNLQSIGTLDPEQSIPLSRVYEALTGEKKDLVHGESFTGRPGTSIFLSDNLVLKIHSNLHLNQKNSEEWARRALESERNYGVHHPSKTWILVHYQEHIWIGNATPLLTPLHQHMIHGDPSQLPSIFNDYFRLYMAVAERFEKMLDAGLSNFGLDTDNSLYYLDDDAYNWDDFSALSSSLGVWVRQYESLDIGVFQSMGEAIRAAALASFKDRHWATVIQEHLRDLYIANDNQKERIAAISLGLGSSDRSTEFGSVRPGALNDLPIGQLFNSGHGKIAILADIHANLPALEAVMEALKHHSVSYGIVLGDIVGYGPHPGECIDLLRSSPLQVIKGNHDHAAATGGAREGFSAMSRWAIDWTIPRLSDLQKAWLSELPLSARGDDWLAIHGAPQDKSFFNGYVYRMTYEDNLDNLSQRGIRYCMHGHTHLTGVYYRKGKSDGHSTGHEFSLDGISHALVCPGSVGQPRGGKTGAEFALFDPENQTFSFYNIDYDIQSTIDDLNRYQFPPQLASRLLQGK